MLTPTRLLVPGASASMNRPGRMPATRQSAARKYIAASELASVSFACAAAGGRGRPRKLTPNALTKDAAANAADSASSAPTAGTRNFNPHDGNCGLRRMAGKDGH